MTEHSHVHIGNTSTGKPIYRASVTVTLELINVDAPEDRAILSWPGTGDDGSDKAVQKAGTSAEKYALLKLFMLKGERGATDTESGADTVQAARSGETSHPPGSVRQGREASSATANQGTPPPARSGTRPLGECVDCKEEGITAKDGRPAVYWPGRNGRPPQCNGKRDGVYLDHQMRPTGVTSGSEPPPHDDTDIPF